MAKKRNRPSRTLKGKQNSELRDRGYEEAFRQKVLDLKRSGESPGDARRIALETYLPDWVGGQPPRDADDAEASPSPEPVAATPVPAADDPIHAPVLPFVDPQFYADRTSKPTDDVKWVYEHIVYELDQVDPKDAPSAGAFGLLLWARVDRDRFYSTCLKPFLSKQQIDNMDKNTLADDGAVQLEFIEEVMRFNGMAKGEIDGSEYADVDGGQDSEVGISDGVSPEGVDSGPRILGPDELAALGSRGSDEGVERVGGQDEGGRPAEPDVADVEEW